MFSGLTNQVSSWMGKKQEEEASKAEGDTIKDEETVKNTDTAEKKESRYSKSYMDNIASYAMKAIC